MDLIDIGPVFEAAGYAEVNRNIVLHLHRLGVNIRLKPRPLGCTRVDLDPDTQALLGRMVHNAHVKVGAALFVFLGGFFEREPGCHSIGLTMLETDRIPHDWVDRCNLMDEVWVPSRFNRDTFVASGVAETKVRVMPLGVDGSRFHPGIPPLPIQGRKGFTFLSVFEWIPRKGYDILLRAYFSEFRPDEDVCLVLKVHDNSSYDPSGLRIRNEIASIREAAGKPKGPPVIILPALMSSADMARLYAAADCFVLPTRGEGWNMTAIEAMACGVPAICTGWSSHLEFMSHDNSLLIDVEGLEPVPAFGIPNDRVYAGSRWARPSEAHLRSLMRWVYENRQRAKDVGIRGCRDVLERFTWDKAARCMYARLLEIENDMEQRRRMASPVAPPPVPPLQEPLYSDRRWNPKRGPVSKLDISGSRPPHGAHGSSLQAPPDTRLPPETLRSVGWKAASIIQGSAPAVVGARVAQKHSAWRDAGWRGDCGDTLPDSDARSGGGSRGPAKRRVARVLMVVPSWGKPCGISEYARALTEHLGHSGVEAVVVTSASTEGILPFLRGSGSRVRDGNAGASGVTVVHFQYEFVLYNISELSSTVSALRALGVPVIATAHDFAPGLARSNEFVARAFHHLIVHSHETRAEYCRVGADPERTTVIPMGCRKYSFDGETAIVETRPAVGFFGFCLPHKGIIELAIAVQEVRRTHPGLKCFMLSSIAPYHSSRTFAAQLDETMARLGVSDSVTIIRDYLPEPEAVRILHAMDVNVLPYRDHGLIGTSAAARTVMSAERPMIVTDVPFFSDLGGEVYKIPSAHPCEIAKGLRRLLEDPELRAELVERMGDFLKRNHWSGIALKHAELYERLAEEDAAGHGVSEV
ncbi:MAG: glycosyltransferase [Firmicutes bacterium]|nr:glycosyltransferase [Bacillota bacterium]MDH7495756.1 glycosyltransferase [Bacillota bacterium]